MRSITGRPSLLEMRPKVEQNCPEADKGRIALLGAGSQDRDSLLDQMDLVERTY